MIGTDDATVILSKSEIPMLRNKHFPWDDWVTVTAEMFYIVGQLVVNRQNTLDFIQEVEGPTPEEIIQEELQAADIMEGIDWR